jgi:hypothetical protein
MRCREVIRELSVPTGGLDPTALAAHLASCHRCATWAEHAARFDQAWERTRPVEAPAGAFERIWARVEHAAGPARTASLPMHAGTPGRRFAGLFTPLAGLAAAALLLLVLGRLGVFTSGVQRPNGPAHPGVANVGPGFARPLAFEFEEGETGIIHVDTNGAIMAQTQPTIPLSETDTVDIEHVLLNYFESQSSL